MESLVGVYCRGLLAFCLCVVVLKPPEVVGCLVRFYYISSIFFISASGVGARPVPRRIPPSPGSETA